MLLCRLAALRIARVLARLAALGLAAPAVAAAAIAPASTTAPVAATACIAGAAARLGLGLANTRHHFAACCLGCGLHHIAAWRLACQSHVPHFGLGVMGTGFRRYDGF